MAATVLWLGGPPGAGKTTVAQRLARRHGLRWYGADTRTWLHRDRAVADGHPAALRFEALSAQARWSASPAQLLAMSLHRERGRMILDDLAALPATPLTIAEGTPVTPAVAGEPAVWLLPTADVQQTRLAGRDLRGGVRTLYRLLAEEIAREVAEHGRRTVVDDGRTLDHVVRAVEQAFGAALRDGPRATTAAARRALLREANDAIVAQYRTYAARSWASPDALSTLRAFACECGRAGCAAEVDRPVGALRRPVLAAEHTPA